MDLTSIIFISGILIPLSVFFFYRKQLENNAQWFIIGGGIIALIGISIYMTSIEIEEERILYLSLLTPLYATLLYKGMIYLFVKLFDRMPVDTTFEFHVNIRDVLFNLLYFIMITIVPMLAAIKTQN
ncbi:hypothetical protein [Aquimarina longa]|uniref:hypothetical protein n=1 Tax=Aquimarina longa TaxID=1080221 RepID=UPI000784FD71|nr:hypothetical protein [Aquimarina longa]